MFDLTAFGGSSCGVPTAAGDDPSIGAVLRGRGPDDVVLVTGDGVHLTAGECLARTAAIGARLAAAGIRAGDRVAVLHDLSADAVLLWWALGRIGAVYLPLNPSWSTRLAHRVVADRRPVVLLAEPRHRPLATGAAEGTGTRVDDVAAFGDGTDDRAPATPASAPADSLADSPADSPAAALDDCCIVHNSGLPGIDHGVRGSWRQFAVMGGNMAAMHPGGRTLVAAPPCFMGVLLTVYGAVASGGSVALLTGLTADTFWPAVRRAGVTTAAMLNPTVADLLARPASPDDRDHPLHLMIGSASDTARNAAAGARFGVHWLAGLGKTEVCGAVGTGLDPTPDEGVGRVRPPFTGRVVDPASGEDVPVDAAGELVLRCDVEGGLPAGYADDPDATAALWRDGWLHTGWHVRRNAAGNLHPVGDNSVHPIVIKRAGYLFAADLEAEIVAVVDGVTAARVGTRPPPDDVSDPTVIAWVVAGDGLSADGVSGQLRAGLPAHLVPDVVVPVAVLPDDAATAPVASGAWVLQPVGARPLSG